MHRSSQSPTARKAFYTLFSSTYRSRTIVNAFLVLVSMIGLWAGSVYVPSAVTQIAEREGYTADVAARWASRATMLLSLGTILGCLAAPWLSKAIGRRGALASFYSLMVVFIVLSFGYAFYLPSGGFTLFLTCLFFLGIGGASFCIFTIWLPEQYGTECRASAFAFATSFGRFIAAAATFIVGGSIAHFGTLGKPVAVTAVAFVMGLLTLPLSIETKGKPLPG